MLQTLLAVKTFKARLVPEGMPASRALVLVSLWEALHLLLLAAVIPAITLYVYWKFFRGAPAGRGREELVLVWLSVPVLFYMARLTDGALSETILRVPALPMLSVSYGFAGVAAVAAIVITMRRLIGGWIVRR